MILNPAVRVQVLVVRRLFVTISNCFAIHLTGDNCRCTNRLRIKDLAVLTEFTISRMVKMEEMAMAEYCRTALFETAEAGDSSSRARRFPAWLPRATRWKRHAPCLH